MKKVILMMVVAVSCNQEAINNPVRESGFVKVEVPGNIVVTYCGELFLSIVEEQITYCKYCTDYDMSGKPVKVNYKSCIRYGEIE